MDINDDELEGFIRNYDLNEPLASMAFDHWDDDAAGAFLSAAFRKVREDFERELAAKLEAIRSDRPS